MAAILNLLNRLRWCVAGHTAMIGPWKGGVEILRAIRSGVRCAVLVLLALTLRDRLEDLDSAS